MPEPEPIARPTARPGGGREARRASTSAAARAPPERPCEPGTSHGAPATRGAGGERARGDGPSDGVGEVGGGEGVGEQYGGVERGGEGRGRAAPGSTSRAR